MGSNQRDGSLNCRARPTETGCSRQRMDHAENTAGPASTATIASPARLVVLAVLLPAAVAATNQWLFESASKSNLAWGALYPPNLARGALYPSMVLSTAILSWCV